MSSLVHPVALEGFFAHEQDMIAGMRSKLVKGPHETIQALTSDYIDMLI